MNEQRFLKYNISAKVTVEQFFSGTMNKQRTLTAFSNILEALCSADEYMIDPNCFSMIPEHVFLNVSNCETGLICLPLTVDKDVNEEVAGLFKQILFSTQFDQSEDAGYITQLITYLNGGASFNVYGLKDLVVKLESSSAAPAQPAYRPPVQPSSQPAPVASAFDSTISIDDMFTTMGGTQRPIQAQPAQQPIQQPVQPAPVAPANRPMTPPVAPQQPIPQPAPVSPVKPIAPVNPVQPAIPRPAVQPQAPQVAIPKPPVSNNPGFAIPGQAAPAVPPVAEQKQKKQKKEKAPAVVAEPKEKKGFMGGLFSSKENKGKKGLDQQELVYPIQGNPSGKPQPPAQNSNGVYPVQTPPVQQTPPVYTPPQYQPPVQPVPVQNSFNETTVLSPGMLGGGETTVLSSAPSMPNPCLTRVKSGEKISINKPVFRIGKEKSYVDYFIGDNTAISRSHCNIHTESGEYFIEDTNSTNHTYLNGKIITSNVKTKLTNGDKVRLANEDFTFSV